MKRIICITAWAFWGRFSAAGQISALSRPAAAAASAIKFSQTEKNMISAGMVNVLKRIPDAVADIRYSTDNNFLGIDFYGEYAGCYLQPDVAEKLRKADSLLKREKPGYRLLLWDCARPLAAQQKMWDALKMPASEKGKYVSNPANKSVHNFGAAVDLSLTDERGKPLDMGTDFDYFGPEAYPFLEEQLMRGGKLTPQQAENRKLLRRIMTGAGFRGVPYEWWHFNSCSRETAKSRYSWIKE